MKEPLFSSGQKAKHLGAHVSLPNRSVTVLACINHDDAEDAALQGFRYVVSHKGRQWSVPEWALRAR